MELSLRKIAEKYAGDEAAAWVDLEEIVWPNGPVCPHCGAVNHAYFLKPKEGHTRTRIDRKTGKTYNPSFRRVWKCAECRKQFSALKGTIFESSHIKVSTWLMAFHLMCANKNGVSAHELHRELEVSYETAWFMCHRIRHAFDPATPKRKLTGTVEMDESYVGGHEKGRHGRPGKDSKKTPVLAAVERGGEIRTRVVADVTGNTLRSAMGDMLEPSATLVTDDYHVYAKVAPGMVDAHHSIDHSREKYGRGPIHTNTVENFWSQYKRSLDGTYHHVSRPHLHRYTAEFEFRYNHRKDTDGNRMLTALGRTKGKRLTYEATVRRKAT